MTWIATVELTSRRRPTKPMGHCRYPWYFSSLHRPPRSRAWGRIAVTDHFSGLCALPARSRVHVRHAYFGVGSYEKMPRGFRSHDFCCDRFVGAAGAIKGCCRNLRVCGLFGSSGRQTSQEHALPKERRLLLRGHWWACTQPWSAMSAAAQRQPDLCWSCAAARSLLHWRRVNGNPRQICISIGWRTARRPGNSSRDFASISAPSNLVDD